MRQQQWERKVYSFTVQKSTGWGDGHSVASNELDVGTPERVSAKSELVTWLGTGIGSVGLTIARILPIFGHPRMAIWICLLAVVAYTLAARSYVIGKRRGWKAEATLIALNVVVILLVLALWLDRSVASATPKGAVDQTRIHLSTDIRTLAPSALDG